MDVGGCPACAVLVGLDSVVGEDSAGWEVELSVIVGTFGSPEPADPPPLLQAASSSTAPLMITPALILVRSMVIASTWPRHHWTLF
ncbi:hypothetical protein [Actinophytocola sp. KF-1]